MKLTATIKKSVPALRTRVVRTRKDAASTLLRYIVPVLRQPVVQAGGVIVAVADQRDGVVLVDAAGVEVEHAAGVEQEVRVGAAHACVGITCVCEGKVDTAMCAHTFCRRFKQNTSLVGAYNEKLVPPPLKFVERRHRYTKRISAIKPYPARWVPSPAPP